MMRKAKSCLGSPDTGGSLNTPNNYEEAFTALENGFSGLQVTDHAFIVRYRGLSKNKKRSALIQHFMDDYSVANGDDSRLSKWQQLCQEVGTEYIPNSIKKCKALLHAENINLWDFMRYRSGIVKNLRKFDSKHALREDARGSPARIFPKERAKADGFIGVFLITLYGNHVSAKC